MLVRDQKLTEAEAPHVVRFGGDRYVPSKDIVAFANDLAIDGRFRLWGTMDPAAGTITWEFRCTDIDGAFWAKMRFR